MRKLVAAIGIAAAALFAVGSNATAEPASQQDVVSIAASSGAAQIEEHFPYN
ncbi:hypothetical protein [Actinophytocola glycyrrhizae]|uniref:Uncharacterized protein n=1 Tax=Actinophytocola glycyrrhizae TaxID=2044873 RepID=A0ABV9S1T3_9PSEU